jgi:uncharacterized coiled-coil protein SlyX
VRGALDLAVHGSIRNLGAHDGLEKGNRLLMAALLEHQLAERHPRLGQQHEILGSDRGINRIAERGLGELLLAAGEQLAGALNVFEGLHVERSAVRARAECSIPLGMDESRIIELELRYMQQSELLQELSDVLYAQQRELGALKAEVELLKRKLEGEPGLVDAKQQERPPHY